MNETILTFSVPNIFSVTIMAVIGLLILHFVVTQMRKQAAKQQA